MWKAVEASIGKVGMGEAKGRREKGRSRKKVRGKGEEETEKGKDDGSEESSRRMGNMERRRGSGEVRSRGKKVGAGEVSQMNKGVWKKAVRKDAYKKIVGSHDRCEGGVYATKRKGVPFIERRKGGG